MNNLTAEKANAIHKALHSRQVPHDCKEWEREILRLLFRNPIHFYQNIYCDN